MSNRSILVTGATGFVGTALCNTLEDRGFNVRRAGRRDAFPDDTDYYRISDFTQASAWTPALQNVDVVVHLAARTHVFDDQSADPLEAYRSVNVLGTTALARQAAASGARRLILLSSIKVMGESTVEAPYSESDAPAPEDAYGISKWEAETALQQISQDTGLETVILRPPLVYGPGVKGNFLRLMNAIERGVPLPFGSVHNQRSLIYVGNLVDAIIACLDAPVAAGKTYLVCDSADLSTPALIRKLAGALCKSPRLIPCPVRLLNLGATMLGKRDVATRLTGSLRVDSSLIRRELGWHPSVSPDQGLNLTVQWYHRRAK